MILQVKITPNASSDSIEGWRENVLRIRIAAPPDKNKANERLVAFLAKTLKIPKRKIEMISGHTARLKRLQIEISQEEFEKFLPNC